MVTQEGTQGDMHKLITCIHEQHHPFPPQCVKILPVSRYTLETVKKAILYHPCCLVLVATCVFAFKVG